MPDEETRAALFRQQETARADWRRDQVLNGLPGDPIAKAAVDAAWEPVTNPERTWDPPEIGDESQGREVP